MGLTRPLTAEERRELILRPFTIRWLGRSAPWGGVQVGKSWGIESSGRRAVEGFDDSIEGEGEPAGKAVA